MAYISKERVAEIRAELKAAFPGVKFSVRREDSTTVCVAILSGDIDFFDDAMRPDGTDNHGRSYKLEDYDKERRYTQVNEYWVESNWKGKALKMLKEVKKIVCAGHFDRNAGDMGADYPNMTFFVDIRIGAWNKPYELKKAA